MALLTWTVQEERIRFLGLGQGGIFGGELLCCGGS